MNRKYSIQLSKCYPKFFGHPSYQEELLKRINTSIEKSKVKKVLEVGGIDRPLLSKGNGYIYDGLDIETNDNCNVVYDHFYVQSIEKQLNDKYDLIISITLLEHVPDNQSSIKSIYFSLNKEGETHHYLPSKWHPYAIALRIVGPLIQKRLIPLLRPGAENVSGYPAYFNYCTLNGMKKLMNRQGFTKINALPYYRANDYFAFLTPLYLLITLFENLCKKLNLSLFASGFIISGTKN